MLKQLDKDAETNSRYSKFTTNSGALINSVCKRDLSVKTPSCITARTRGHGSQS